MPALRKIIAAVLLLHEIEGLPNPVPRALAFSYHKTIPMGVLDRHYACLAACLASGLPPDAWTIPVIQAALEMTSDVPTPDDHDLGVASHSLKRCVLRVFQLAMSMRRVGRVPRSLLVQELLRRALLLLPAPEPDGDWSDADSSNSEVSSTSESTTLQIPRGCQILPLGTIPDADPRIEACNVCVRFCCLIAADITLKSR